jgi:putative transcriptional regulator
MTANHHPHPDTLICYVGGTLSNAISCVVACHLSLCRNCADSVRRLEILGGIMLKSLEPSADDNAFSERAIVRWTPQGLPSSERRQDTAPNGHDALLPLPLARHLRMEDGDIPWAIGANGVVQYAVGLPEGSGQLRLHRLSPGALLPAQTDPEAELVLVLRGQCRADDRDHARGDVMEGDGRPELRASGDRECVLLIGGDVKERDVFRDRQVQKNPLRTPFMPAFRVRRVPHLIPALAASIAMIVGIGFGWILRGETEGKGAFLDEVVGVERNRLIARGPLQSTLETSPSGRQTASISPDGKQFRLSVKMTFQNATGDYCREYGIASASPERYAGLACRSGGQWTIRIQALLPPARSASEQTIPAGGNADAAIDTAIGALIEGDPLAVADEAAVINRGWKK